MRTTVYIDGFNLYFAMRRLKDKSLYWLDLHKLGQKLARTPEVTCKYFTSRIGGRNKSKRDRQNIYLEALDATGNVKIILGGYSTVKVSCPGCREQFKKNEEKKTDVNIALEIAGDAYDEKVERVILISTDTDLAPAFLFLKNRFPEIHRTVAFPPTNDGRPNKSLRNLSTDSDFQMINRNLLKACQLPDSLSKDNGFVLERPAEWL